MPVLVKLKATGKTVILFFEETSGKLYALDTADYASGLTLFKENGFSGIILIPVNGINAKL